VRALAYSDDPAGKFFWELLSGTLIYAANRIPEIADDVVSVDNAMKWGFGWDLGPFETWDSIGLARSVQKMVGEGKQVPAWVVDMVESGQVSFYGRTDGQKSFFDISSKDQRALEPDPKDIDLALLTETGAELKRNWCASLIDIGDGVACLQFHSALQPEMNPIDPSIIDMMADSVAVIESEGLRGLVVGHQGKHFSAGANLALIINSCETKDWPSLEAISRTFQDAAQKLKFAPFPVVSAPFSMCLGGGYEAAAGADRILNNLEAMAKARTGPFPVVQKAFETIGFARVSSSAKEAVKLGYLRRTDQIVLNPAHLLHEAKCAVLSLSEGYQPPEPKTDILLPGEGGRLAIECTLDDMAKAGKISNHDRLIGKKLAYVLSGGDQASATHPLDEQTILDLEREAFLSLCGEKLSLDRMKHMLAKGKPLRN
jgi:3-hydroxyacyl-CoA dehydrogenase